MNSSMVSSFRESLAQLGDLRSWLASQRIACDFIGSISAIAVRMGWQPAHSNVLMSNADAPGAMLPGLMRSSQLGQCGHRIDVTDGPAAREYCRCMRCTPANEAGALQRSQSPIDAYRCL